MKKTTMARIDIQRAVDDTAVPADPDLQRAALAALADRPDVMISLRVVDEAEGRVLNRDFRGKDYATNVLSFPAEIPAELEIPLLGDIALCAPVIEREARTQGKPLAHHWAHLVIHGILHLKGFDHARADQAARMEAEEVKLLAGLGIPNPY